jgi:hypothetical protein
VINPERQELLGQVRLLRAWTLLGGRNDTVLVLQEDSLGVEAVTSHRVDRRR